MIDPITAVGMATSAFNAIKKGIAVGRDIQDMSGQLSQWGKAFSDFSYAEDKAQNPPWYKFSGSDEETALQIFTQKKKINWARVIALGVIPEYQKKGIDGALYYECLERAAKHGIMQGEASWILEDNLMMNRGAETMQGRIYKKYRKKIKSRY